MQNTIFKRIYQLIQVDFKIIFWCYVLSDVLHIVESHFSLDSFISPFPDLRNEGFHIKMPSLFIVNSYNLMWNYFENICEGPLFCSLSSLKASDFFWSGKIWFLWHRLLVKEVEEVVCLRVSSIEVKWWSFKVLDLCTHCMLLGHLFEVTF